MSLAFAVGTMALAASALEAQAQWRYGWGGPYGYYGPGYGYYGYYGRPYVYAPGYVYDAPAVYVRPRYGYYRYGWGPRTSNLRSGYTRVSPNYDGRW